MMKFNAIGVEVLNKLMAAQTREQRELVLSFLAQPDAVGLHSGIADAVRNMLMQAAYMETGDDQMIAHVRTQAVTVTSFFDTLVKFGQDYSELGVNHPLLAEPADREETGGEVFTGDEEA